MSVLIDVPGYGALDIRHVLLDYNGTIAVDGSVPEIVKEKLIRLSEVVSIHVLTADTHGTAQWECSDLPLEILTFPSDCARLEKLRILQKLNPAYCMAVGNGRNDIPMCEAAALSVCVMGSEGAYGKLMLATDVCVSTPLDALDLLLEPKRLIATLRG